MQIRRKIIENILFGKSMRKITFFEKKKPNISLDKLSGGTLDPTTTCATVPSKAALAKFDRWVYDRSLMTRHHRVVAGP